jgi:putative addiction module antidote
MNKPLKLIPIGNSTGVILPKEVLRELGAERGQSISYIKTPHGIELRPHDAAFERQMEVAREVMRRHRSALRELAK